MPSRRRWSSSGWSPSSTEAGIRSSARSAISLEVTADIFKEGHDVLAAFLRYRGAGETRWREAPMRLVDNDRWAGEFPLEHNGRYRFFIEAVADPFLSWLADLAKRMEAGQDVASELAEGRALIEATARRARGADARDLRAIAERMATARSQAEAVAVAHEATLAALMARHLDRRYATRTEREYEVTVDRERARFAAWYELFPRSARGDGQHATFKDAERELPRIAAMGFDVVYLPPIHPIGHAFRKGRNNALSAAPGDPGQPMGHRRRRRRPHRRASAARDPRGLRPLRGRRGGARARGRPRLRHPVLARPSLRRARTPSGSSTGPTAPSSTRRTRPRSTRTSTR